MDYRLDVIVCSSWNTQCIFYKHSVYKNNTGLIRSPQLLVLCLSLQSFFIGSPTSYVYPAVLTSHHYSCDPLRSECQSFSNHTSRAIKHRLSFLSFIIERTDKKTNSRKQKRNNGLECQEVLLQSWDFQITSGRTELLQNRWRFVVSPLIWAAVCKGGFFKLTFIYLNFDTLWLIKLFTIKKYESGSYFLHLKQVYPVELFIYLQCSLKGLNILWKNKKQS